MKNLSQMLKQAKEMQDRMGRMQDELAHVELRGQSGGGLVALTLNGKGDLKKVEIDPSLMVAEEKDVLEDLLVAAHHDAKQKVEAHAAAEMSKLTGGLQLPPGMKLPF